MALYLNADQFNRVADAISRYPHNAEEAINDILHNEGAEKIQERIRMLMPSSGKNWRGKAPAAKASKSMKNVNGNLFVEVKSAKRWNYLYFPDDGSNTTRHVGNQQFFFRGAEAAQNEIVDHCVARLVSEFEN